MQNYQSKTCHTDYDPDHNLDNENEYYDTLRQFD